MPLAVSLDGEWAFHYAENLTAPFSDWDTLTVPGFIQMPVSYTHLDVYKRQT